MLKERVPLKGRLSIALNGEVVREVENLVVATGTDWVASRMSNTTVADITQMVIGTDATGAVATDTWIGGSTVNMDTSKSQVTDLAIAGGTVTGSDVQFSTTFLGTGEGGQNAAINEAGLLTSDNSLIARTTFNTVNKDNNDEMTITWTISISSS